jgi:4-hydroxyphenylpyruvate dioxygenase-like putative hemolysin
MLKWNKREVKCMKLIEEIYEMYRGRIKGTDEDLDLIALTILEDTSRNELLELIQEMETEELQYFFRLYIFETLKEKWSNSEERVRLEKKSLH